MFRMAAKLTQRIYGTINKNAVIEIAKKFTIVQNIASHRSTITTRAPPIDLPLSAPTPDLTHKFYQQQEQINGGKNNMFAAMANVGGWAMGYFDGSTMKLWKWAQEYTLAEYHEVMNTNLTSAFNLSQLAYPEMKKAGGGKIINIGSMMSIFGAAFASMTAIWLRIHGASTGGTPSGVQPTSSSSAAPSG